MSTITGVSTGPGYGASIVTGVSGQTPPPNPTTNPLILNGPLDTHWRPPPGASNVQLKVTGSGADGGYGTTSAAPGNGGGAGAYAEIDVADGVWASGGNIVIHLAPPTSAGGDGTVDFSSVKINGQTGYIDIRNGNGGNLDGAGGAASTVGLTPGLILTSNTTGGSGALAAGSVGGKGGDGPNGEPGGVGGDTGEFGGNGTAPGAGGGGGGGDPFLGGKGAQGRIIISWTPPA